ncbi:MAG: helix-turn-helix transcriptional regulator [Saccharospirillum sp.]
MNQSPPTIARDQPPLKPAPIIDLYDALLESLYRSVEQHSGLEAFLMTLCELLNCYTATLTDQNLRTRRLLSGWFANMPDDAIHWYLSHLLGRDPLLDKAFEQSTPRFVATNLHFHSTQSALSQRRVRQWKAQLGVSNAASAALSKDPEMARFLTLTRKPGAPPFSSSELALLDRLLTHISRALTLKASLSRAYEQGLSSIWSPVLEQLKLPLVVLDPLFRVSFVNQPARHWLESTQLANLQRQCLIFQSEHHHAAFFLRYQATLKQGSLKKEASHQTLALPPEGVLNKHGLSLTFIPVNADGTDEKPGNAVHAVAVIIHPWEQRLSINADETRRRFGLSKTQARVCELLCTGLTPDAIALRLGREPSTVQSHLKALFRKTGTHRQSELVALVLSTLFRL